jgi:hypothetical protein
VVDKSGPPVPPPHGSIIVSNFGAVCALYVVEI